MVWQKVQDAQIDSKWAVEADESSTAAGGEHPLMHLCPKPAHMAPIAAQELTGSPPGS
jgi:hypothetical protein